jgi:hypothetical protein
MILGKGECKMTQAFETEFTIGIGTLSGGITGITVKEKDVRGIFQNSLIIRADREWQITLNWMLKGTMLDQRWLDIQGNWVLKAYLEGFGRASEIDRRGDSARGIEVDPAPVVVKVGSLGPNDPPETEWRYTETFTFPAGAIREGTYKLALTVTYVDDAGIPGPMAGFIEYRDMLQIYNPGP